MNRDINLANFNDMYTPDYAIDYITDFLPKDKVYWESCYWEWHLAESLKKRWYKVVWYKWLDCLINQPSEDWDIWLTNPPFRWNKKFIKRALELWKSFISLQRLEHLWWKEAMEVFNNPDIQVIIPEKRIDYLTPKILRGEKTWWATFHSVFICYKMNLPKDILYIKKK